MKKLNELIGLITPGKLKQISLLDPRLGKETKLMQLYHGVHKNLYTDDTHALMDIYGAENVGSKYSKLKNDLENRLLNLLLAIDLNNGHQNERQRAYLKYFKMWAAANILVKLGVTNYAIQLLERILKHFQKHEFTYLCLETTKVLRNHYFRHLGNLKKGTYYDELTKNYLDQYIAETKLGGYLEFIVAQYVKQKSNKSQLNETIQQYLQDAQQFLPKQSNGTIQYRFKMLEVSRYLNANNYQKASEVCAEAVYYYEHQNQHYRTYIVIFLNHWIICSTQLKDYHLATKLVQKALSYLKEGEYNWFKLMEYQTQLAFYKEDYPLAYQSYKRVFNMPQLKTLPEQIQEEWRLFEAYAEFVKLCGKTKVPLESRRKFKVHKFLNEVNIFSQDKKGMNIPIFIIHFSYMILYQYDNQVIDRIDSIEKYRQRYLNQKTHFRSNLFIKMLLVLIKNQHKPLEIRRQTEPLLQEMQTQTIGIYTRDHAVEIIPYENLWSMLMELNGNRHRIPSVLRKKNTMQNFKPKP